MNPVAEAVARHGREVRAAEQAVMRRCLALLLAATALAGCGASGGGVTGLETVHAFYMGDPTDDQKDVQAPCPVGKKALGGGFELAAGGLPIDVQFSEPVGNVGQAPTGWQAFAMETTPVGATEEWSFDVFAVCANA